MFHVKRVPDRIVGLDRSTGQRMRRAAVVSCRVCRERGSAGSCESSGGRPAQPTVGPESRGPCSDRTHRVLGPSCPARPHSRSTHTVEPDRSGPGATFHVKPDTDPTMRHGLPVVQRTRHAAVASCGVCRERGNDNERARRAAVARRSPRPAASVTHRAPIERTAYSAIREQGGNIKCAAMPSSRIVSASAPCST